MYAEFINDYHRHRFNTKICWCDTHRNYKYVVGLARQFSCC